MANAIGEEKIIEPNSINKTFCYSAIIMSPPTRQPALQPQLKDQLTFPGLQDIQGLQDVPGPQSLQALLGNYSMCITSPLPMQHMYPSH